MTKRNDDARALRAQGLTYREIGERMGISGQSARGHVIAGERRERAKESAIKLEKLPFENRPLRSVLRVRLAQRIEDYAIDWKGRAWNAPRPTLTVQEFRDWWSDASSEERKFVLGTGRKGRDEIFEVLNGESSSTPHLS